MGLSRGSSISDFQANVCSMPPAIRRDNMRAKPLLGQRCTPSRVRAAQWTWSWIHIDDSRHAWRMVLECWREPHPLRKASRTVGRCRWRFCDPPPLRRRCDGCWLCHRCRRRRCDKRLCFRRRGGVWLGGCGWPLGSNRLRFFYAQGDVIKNAIHTTEALCDAAALHTTPRHACTTAPPR